MIFKSRRWAGRVLITLLPTALLQHAAVAVRTSNGQVFFDYPPSLVKATTTFPLTRVGGSIYKFTLSMPENAGEPLQRVTFDQKGNADLIDFERHQTRIVKVKRSHGPDSQSTASISQNPSTKAVTVVLNPPVPPGSTMTIRLLPEQNPDISGYYLFGVRAFPAGDNSYGQFLGYGRLYFYDNDRGGSP
jgi:hypothetical protein